MVYSKTLVLNQITIHLVTTNHLTLDSEVFKIQQEVPFGVEPQPLAGNFYTYKTRESLVYQQRKFFDVDDVARL